MGERKPGEAEAAPKLADDFVMMYRLHRDRVTQEDAVINHRMTWLLWSQAILFGLWGGLFAGELNYFDILIKHYIAYFGLKIFEGTLCIAAGIASFGSWLTLIAAIDEIERIKRLYKNIKTTFGYTKSCEEELFGMVTGRRVHYIWGHIVTKCGPWFFVFIWVILLFIFIMRPLIDTQGLGATS
jgi:hypothetical protein